MKRRAAILFLGLAIGVARPSLALTYVGSNEIFLSADVDGDGRPDAVIVDVETGAYRIGYQLAADVFTWADARASGISGVASVSSGRIFGTTSDALAFTSPTENRVNVLAAADPSAEGQSTTVFPDGLGPLVVVSLNLLFPPITPQDDLVCSTALTLGSAGNQTLFVSSGGGAIARLTNAAAGQWLAGDRVQLRVGGTNYVGAVEVGASGLAFGVYQLGPSGVTKVAGSTSVPGVSFVYAQFAAQPQSQFLFYAGGQPNLTLQAVLEPTPGKFSLAPAVVFSLGSAIDQVFVLSDSPNRLLVLFNDGSQAGIYDFDGVHAPTVRQSIAADAGSAITGALPLGGGAFHLLTGAIGGRRSTQFYQYKFNGSSYAQVASGGLPSVSAAGLAANVFYFQQNPFLFPSSLLLGQANAADWSDSAVLGGTVAVRAEKYSGTNTGLATPTVRTLGAPPAGAGYALVNQYNPSISVAGLDASTGPAVGGPVISPPPGAQRSAVKIAIQSTDPSFDQILFSINGAAWSAYSAPFWIFSSGSIQFCAARSKDAVKTPVQTAIYTFSTGPGRLDSDGDGVPDFVEIYYGLDPTKGADSDGDGFTDLNEILAGSDPANPASVPNPASPVEDFQSFDLLDAPIAFDGNVLANAAVAPGIAGAAHALDGSLLQSSAASNNAQAVLSPAFSFARLRTGLDPGLIAVATDANFDVDTPASDKQIGRQLLGVVAAPRVAPPNINYNYGAGPLAAEAKNWVAAARSAYASASRPLVNVAFGVGDTLAALLFERAVDQMLLSRNVPGFTGTNLTLFGFRKADAGRPSPSLAQLAALETPPVGGGPAFDLASVHGILHSNVFNAAFLNSLYYLAQEFYRVSSLSNNASPGLYPQPVDAIRAFLVTGQVVSNYAGNIDLSADGLAAATASAVSVLGTLAPRPQAVFDLSVVSDSFSTPGCVKLQDNASGAEIGLFAKAGVPFEFPSSFLLVPGSTVKVQAYTDFVEPSSCAPRAVQVIEATLESSPFPTAAMGAGQGLLPASWSNFFFGGRVDPYADEDGDGASNLQEFLDGTDPANPASHAPAARLSPPSLTLRRSVSAGAITEKSGSSEFVLTFSFSPAYSSFFSFQVQSAKNIKGPFVEAQGAGFRQINDVFQVEIGSASGAAEFYRVVMTLR